MSASLIFLNSDSRILEQIRNGDEQALVTLFEKNRTPVTAFVVRNSGTRDDAEDLLQEAVIVLWERVRSGRFHYSSALSTFIIATARNKWLRLLARKRKELPMMPDGNEFASEDVSSLDIVIEEEEALKLREALEKLGDPCKTILLLYYYDQCSMQEIAQRMGFANADTVKSKKYQCKKALEKAFMRGRE
jgi:RNA polymerase sigma factor (sigma-70 family)